MSVTTKCKDGVLWVTMNAKATANALNPQMVTDLRSGLSGIQSRPDAHVIVLESALSNVFSLGLDLGYFKMVQSGEISRQSGERAVAEYLDLLRDMLACPIPIVAVVKGVTAAGGVDLAFACDIVIASSDATFIIPQIRKGIFPSTTSAILIPRIGQSQFLLWAFRTIPFSAARLADLGLVAEVCPSSAIDRTVDKLTRQIARFPSSAVRTGMQAVRGAVAAETGHRLEIAGHALTANLDAMLGGPQL